MKVARIYVVFKTQLTVYQKDEKPYNERNIIS